MKASFLMIPPLQGFAFPLLFRWALPYAYLFRFGILYVFFPRVWKGTVAALRSAATVGRMSPCPTMDNKSAY